MINAAKAHDHQFKVMLHLDTGMNRLGFSAEETALLSGRDDLDCLDWQLILSHLAMADEPDDPMNAEQKAAFDHFLETRPGNWLMLRQVYRQRPELCWALAIIMT